MVVCAIGLALGNFSWQLWFIVWYYSLRPCCMCCRGLMRHKLRRKLNIKGTCLEDTWIHCGKLRRRAHNHQAAGLLTAGCPERSGASVRAGARGAGGAAAQGDYAGAAGRARQRRRAAGEPARELTPRVHPAGCTGRVTHGPHSKFLCCKTNGCALTSMNTAATTQ